MRVRPPKASRTLVSICLLTLFLSTVLFYLSSFLPFSSVLQVVGLLSLVAFLFLTIRYGLSEYEYVLEGSELAVYRKQGKKIEMLCNVELKNALLLCERKEFRAQKPSYALCYNFCQNLASEKKRYLLFVFDDRVDKRALILFEPGKEMEAEIFKLLKDSTPFDKKQQA